jgi:hypothetical protein
MGPLQITECSSACIRMLLLAFAGLGPALFWGVFFLGVGLHDHGLGWKPELWGGGLAWSALSVLGVAWALTATPVVTPTDAKLRMPLGSESRRQF